MRLPKFDYYAPQTLKEALNLLAKHGEDARVLSGGTDLMVKMNHGLLKPNAVIAIQGIEGLDEIRFDTDRGLTIGATARLADVASHPDILARYPALVNAILSMANVEVRNMGTVAGNLCNAAPSADTAPPLVAMGAEVTLVGPEGERRIPLDRFFLGPGLTAVEHGEIVTAIEAPVPPERSGASYKRISGRCGVDIAATGVAARAVFEGESCTDARIVLGAVAPIPMRAEKTEALMQGKEWTAELIAQGGEEAAREAKPITDVRACAEWRERMVAVLTRRVLEEARERAFTR